MAGNEADLRRAAGSWRFIPAFVAALATFWFLRFLGPVSQGDTPNLVLPWVPQLGISFALRLDGLSLAFALLICGIGSLVFLYAATYFREDRRLGGLLLTLAVFGLSMLGLVTADDVVSLFIFWEGTTITSWLLVGFDHERASARAAALQALLITGLGGLALLAGLVLMADVAGTGRVSEIVDAGEALRASPLYDVVFGLVMLGCLTKSAQFPFHFWLPNAMAAPTPVSAYLHSATMVKAGIYLIARLNPALGDTELWSALLVPVGALTMLLGAVWAVRQTDLKLMLAQTTVMALGLLTLLLGIGTPAAMLAAMTFLLVHAFYKAGLFLAVGMIEKGAGSRDVRDVAGLAAALPVTAGAVTVAALSMAGFPPLAGFIGKELIYGATEQGSSLVLTAVVVANALMVASAGLVAIRPFRGALRAPKGAPADPGAGLWLGPVVLATLGLVFGLLPTTIERGLVVPMVRAVSGEDPVAHLGLWHGVGPALLLSLVTLAAGALLYAALDGLRALLVRAETVLPRTEGGYAAALSALLALARGVTRAVQPGTMTVYLRRTFLVLAALIGGAILIGRGPAWPAFSLSRALIDWAIFGLILLSTGAVLAARSRLTAITALGGIGAGIALVFVVYGAIDVAMTQLFVEVLVVVFLAVAMVRLPAAGGISFRATNALVAGGLGLVVTLAVLSVQGSRPDPYLTRFFEAESVSTAHGRNIVNVILVDFRGFDTLGEVSVIVLAGVAAIAVLAAGRRASR